MAALKNSIKSKTDQVRVETRFCRTRLITITIKPREKLHVKQNLTRLAASRFLFSYCIRLLLFCRRISYDVYHSLDEESHLLSAGDIDKVSKKVSIRAKRPIRPELFLVSVALSD